MRRLLHAASAAIALVLGPLAGEASAQPGAASQHPSAFAVVGGTRDHLPALAALAREALRELARSRGTAETEWNMGAGPVAIADMEITFTAAGGVGLYRIAWPGASPRDVASLHVDLWAHRFASRAAITLERDVWFVDGDRIPEIRYATERAIRHEARTGAERDRWEYIHAPADPDVPRSPPPGRLPAARSPWRRFETSVALGARIDGALARAPDARAPLAD